MRTGVNILRRSLLLGLLDTAIPEDLQRKITEIMARHARHGVRFHALRTRQAGAWRFVDFHVLVPGDWSVQRGHDLLEEIEEEVREAVPNSSVFTHLEPIEDPASFADVRLERDSGTPGRRAPARPARRRADRHPERSKGLLAVIELRLRQPHLHRPRPLFTGSSVCDVPPGHRVLQPVGRADAGLEPQIVVRPAVRWAPSPHS